jgi:hypothetical protein
MFLGEAGIEPNQGRLCMRKAKQPHVFHFRQAYAVHLATAALAFILSSCPLMAQFMVRPVNLAYLARRADVIVQGRIRNVKHERLPGFPNIPTVEVTLDIEKMVRGPAGNTYTFREVFLGLRPKEGKQGYRIGQQLFLFLPSPSQHGLSSPIGIEQGRFHIVQGAGGGAVIVNEQGNAGLFRNVEQDANRAGKQLTASQSRTASIERGPVSLDEFVSLVRSLTSLPRIQ